MTDEVAIKLSLKDVRQFIADAKAGKLSVEDLEKAVDRADRVSGRTASSGGGMFKLRSLFAGYWLQQGAIGMARAAGQVAAFGVRAASSTEQAKIGFTTLLGSAGAAQKMLDDLAAFAAHTPFELQGLRETASMMLGMGWSAKRIIPDLTAVGDAMSGLGRSQEDVKGTINALGQMMQSGKVNRGDMFQLTSRGIAAWQILADTLHRTVPEVQKMSEKGLIPASVGLNALIKGMENGTAHAKAFKGMMADQSTTLAGMASNVKDYAAQLADAMTQPLLPGMKAVLGGVSDRLQTAPARATAWMSRAGTSGGVALGALRHGDAFGAAVGVDRIFGGTGALTAPLMGLIRIGLSVRTIWGASVVPAFRTLREVLAPFAAVLAPVRSIPGLFALMAKHTTVLKVALVALGLGFAAFKIYKTTIGAITLATKIWAGAQALLNTVLSANPIGLIVIGVAALIVGLIYAYKHSSRFRAIVQAVGRAGVAAFHWVVGAIQTLWGWIKKLGDGKFWSGLWDGLKSGFKAAINWVIDGLNWVIRMANKISIPGTDIGLHIPEIPKLATGGTVTDGGVVSVGEAGRELVRLPRGASVIPLSRAAEHRGGAPAGDERTVILQVDSRELARATFRGRDRLVARL